MKRLIQLCVLVLLLGSAHTVVAASSLVDHYRKAVAADPQNPNLRYHLGVALLNRGQNREALEAFRTVYPERVDDPEINFNLALVYTRLQDPDSALLFLDQALANGADKEPDIYPLQNAYFNLVLLYAEQNRLDEALELLQRLVGENPERFDYLRQLGDYQLQSGRIDAAVQTLGAYLHKMPEDEEIRDYLYAALFNRGLEAYQAQDLAAARKIFSQALEVRPDPRISYYLALFDYQQQHYAQVAERLPQVYPQLAEEARSNARAMLYNTALALKQQGDLAAARRALAPLNEAAQPRPKDLALLAGIELQAEDFEAARGHYLRVLQLEPGNAIAADGVLAAEKGAFNQILDRAGQAFAANDLLAVRSALDEAAAIYPQDNRLRIYQMRLQRALRDDWSALLKKAQSLEQGRQYAEALRILRQGLTLAPSEPQLLRFEKRLVGLLDERIDTLYRQGEEDFAAGDLMGSRRSFTQLLELSPEHQGARDYLQKIDRQRQLQAQRAIGAGEAALAAGDPLGGRKAFRRALNLLPDEPAAADGLRRSERLLAARVGDSLVRARRARAEGDLVSARLQLQEALGRWPDEGLRQELEQVEQELGKRRGSLIELTRKAIDRQEFRRAGSLLGQVESFGPSQDFEELNRELQAARRSLVASQLELARREIAAGRFDVGLKAFRRVLDLEPDNDEARQGIRQGRKELQQVISRLVAEGTAARQAGRLEQARSAYREVLTLDPHQGEALTALRQIERAEGAGLSGADVGKLYLQGIAFYTEGDYRQAIAVWRQVLDLDPGHEKARMNIDKAERKLRQIRERQSG